MTDLSLLTKEQLLELLRQKEEAEKPQSQGIPSPQGTIVQASSPIKPLPATQISVIGGPCQYRPVRSNQAPCAEQSINEWDFCKKHSRTVQAKKARERWETKNMSDLHTPTSSSHSLVSAQIQPVSQPLVGENDDIDTRWRTNKRAMEIVTHMQTTLNMELGGEVSENLDRMFTYILLRLPEVDLNNDPKAAHEVISLLEPLYASWQELVKRGDEPAKEAARIAEQARNKKPQAVVGKTQTVGPVEAIEPIVITA